MNYIYVHNEDRHILRYGDDKLVRCVRHPTQRDLVQSLLEQHVPVQLCSSWRVPGHSSNPSEALDKMYGLSNHIPGYAGGWRDADDFDIATLELADRAPEDVYAYGNDVVKLIRRHPAIEAGVAFAFNGVITSNVSLLLRHIGDITRFVDPDHPLRGAPLRSYYRVVTPKYLKSFCAKAKTDSANRAGIAFMAWNVNPFIDKEWKIEEPHAFLARYMLERKRRAEVFHEEYDAKIEAIWRTTVKFLDFLRLIWLEQLGGPKFDPYRFFDRKEDAGKFAQYVAR
jgi:hypothetical protein